MTDPRFDDMRPYEDSEIPAAMQRIAGSDYLALMASFVFPGRDVGSVREMVRSLRTTDEFQRQVMWHVNKQIERRSISRLSYGGMEALDPAVPYLFVSNHRDIMLDASLLQNILADNGFPTTQITFGANLMSSQLLIDIGRSNKMFRVERGGGSIKDFYRSSLHLSDYIRYTICTKGESVWIAQRNGRTKDGVDRTDQGIVKMFWSSAREDKIGALASLNIVPVAISYEWEPCDIQKALELYQSRLEKYVKKPGEDLSSILSGISEPKGRVHIELCAPLRRDELEVFAPLTGVEYNRAVAGLIDSRILSAYRLSPNNYIAHDLRFASTEFYDKGLYTDEQAVLFAERLESLDAYEVDDPDMLRDIFLGIYSNPVDNCL